MSFGACLTSRGAYIFSGTDPQRDLTANSVEWVLDINHVIDMCK